MTPHSLIFLLFYKKATVKALKHRRLGLKGQDGDFSVKVCKEGHTIMALAQV